MSDHGTGTAQVLDQGRVTIPKHIREDLGIEKGDHVIIDVRAVQPIGGVSNGD